MRNSNRCSEIYRKLAELNKNCGVKLRTKAESLAIIKERLSQLSVEQKQDSKEFIMLTLMLARIV